MSASACLENARAVSMSASAQKIQDTDSMYTQGISSGFGYKYLFCASYLLFLTTLLEKDKYRYLKTIRKG